MKADKLRQVANKYVRDLNDPIMESNLQVCPSFAIVSCFLYGVLLKAEFSIPHSALAVFGIVRYFLFNFFPIALYRCISMKPNY